MTMTFSIKKLFYHRKYFLGESFFENQHGKLSI